MKPMITGIAFTAYPAEDVAALRGWYEKNLGLTFREPLLENGVEMYSEANVGDGYFSLMTNQWIGRAPGSASGIVFEVEDIDETVADLRRKGLEVEDPYTTPVCKVCSLVDSEGNKVTLHQITVPH